MFLQDFQISNLIWHEILNICKNVEMRRHNIQMNVLSQENILKAIFRILIFF